MHRTWVPVFFEASPRPRRLHLFALVGVGCLAIGAACLGSGNDTAGSATGRAGLDHFNRPPAILAWEASLPLLPEDKPRSIRYQQAKLRWRTATVAFDRQAFDEAAENFLEVAKTLKSHRPHPHASTFATARCLAYENAGRALSQLEDIETGRSQLQSAVADDAACPYAIRRALSNLYPRPKTIEP
ncbi:MAG: hypothetical protein AAFN74_02370 [Myxococcota bacterium]